MIDHPYETKSDSFYFVDNKLVMHNKASYRVSSSGSLPYSCPSTIIVSADQKISWHFAVDAVYTSRHLIVLDIRIPYPFRFLIVSSILGKMQRSPRRVTKINLAPR
jgi:GMP-PDE, delta subunit